ncbi:unnamed protein product [Victoria cruziana]
MGQLADAMSHRYEGSLPSQPLDNSKGKGQMFVVDGADRQELYDVETLRSGREHQPSLQEQQEQTTAPHHQSTLEVFALRRQESVEERMTRSPPFLKALEKSSSTVRDREVRMQDMLEMFRVVRINLPLIDAISRVPAYARFLKELCTKKRKSRKIPKSVLLSEETSSFIQMNIPHKLEDPGAPIIPCIIGDIRVELALLDLGASVNVLPKYFYDVFQLGGLKPTSMTIQLADRSVKAPRGVLEDILFKVKDFIFLVDFVILDMEEVDVEHQTPIIIGRPFLATINACINCRTGIVEIPFGDKKLMLNIFHATIGPASDRCISFAEADDDDAEDAAHKVTMSIFKSSIADLSSDFTPDADVAAMYDSSLELVDLDSDFDFSSSHYSDSIV